MSDIRINQFSRTASTAKTSGRRAKKDAAVVPEDKFQHAAQSMKQLDSDAVKKFFDDSKNATEAVKAHSHYKPIPRLNETAAGWQVSMMGQGGTNCYMKVPLSDKNKMLVVPLENHMGGAYAKPAVIDFEKGVVGIAEVQPFGDSQGLNYSQSADNRELYIFNRSGTRIDSYDENLKPTGSIDLLPIDGDLEHILAFTPASSGHYVFASKKHFGPGILMALDPQTGKPRWQKDSKNTFVFGIKEGPDKNIYMVMGDSMDSKPSIEVYNPDGKLLKKFTGFKDPHQLTFTPDGNALITDNRQLKKLRIKDKGILSKSIQPKEMWSVKGDFRRFHISDDGKYVFAADTKSGYSRSHGLMKINMETGEVEWNREKFGENYIDHKIVGDEICLLTSSEDRKTSKMVRLDMNGNETWEGSTPGVIDEYEIGKIDAVSGTGHFLVGGREDGHLTCLRPRQQGEDEKSIEGRISIKDRMMEKALESVEDKTAGTETEKAEPEQGLEIHDNFVVIGGVKLEKKKKQD